MTIFLFFFLVATQVTLAQGQPKMGEVKLPAGTERRLALVIAMSNYQNIGPLKNPPNDADDMVAALEQLGFKRENIVVIKNQGLGYVQSQINLFVNSLRANDIVFFYFSGHGIGYNGDNYLLPIDARLDCLEEIPNFGISVNQLQAAFRGRGVRNNFLVLDACRNLDKKIVSCQLFAQTKTATTAKGLVIPQNQLEGDAIVYATQQGEEADDNVQQRNGLFTQMLLKYLVLPDLSFYQIMTKTTKDVLEESQRRVEKQLMKGRQLPAMYGSLGLEFVFVQSPPKPDDPEKEAMLRRQAELEAENARLREAANKNTTAAQPDNTRVTPPMNTKKAAKFLDLPFADMAYIEGETFQMGDTRNEGESIEKPVHTVTVSSFWMSKYEVTQRQWTQIMGSNPSYFKGCDDCPVENVSWDDVQEFLKKLNARTGGNYRLPTEAEWEYAAGGGANKRTRFGNGKDILDLKEANFDARTDYKKDYSVVGAYSQKTVKVGSFDPNILGLYDISGNVWEWCSDWYGSYSNAVQENPKGPATGPFRVLRGGSWDYTPIYARVAFRFNYLPVSRRNYIGFRVVSQIQ
jgi:formylglycine-generating enzyme required for sulfatase activity